jgi:protein ImuB
MYACLHAKGNPALLVECARYFSPRIEETSPDTVLVDVRGLKTLFGEPKDIAQAMANRAGIPVDVAISVDPDAAVMAARGFRGLTVIAPGREAAVLAPLPLNLLSGSPQTAELLDAWGIHTLGELAALPPLGVAARLGNEGTHLQQLAQGQAGRQIRPLEDALRFEDELELDHPVELLEPLSFLLSRLLTDLCTRLTFHALATDEIRLTLTLENTAPHYCALRLPVPMREVKTLLKLLQLELSARPPAAPILKVGITLNPVKPRTQQHGLFLALAPEPAKLEVTLSRLSNLLGKENVGTPELIDTHRTDSFRMNRFAATHPRQESDSAATAALVLRRCRPPKYAHVRLQNEVPVHIAAGQIQGRVLAHAGPWRSSGDWWKTDPWDHAEWDVALSLACARGSEGNLLSRDREGAYRIHLYRIYEDIRTGRWFLEGTYD